MTTTMRTLLVEDHGPDALVTRSYLSRISETAPVWVASLAEALEYLASSSVDVVVTDLGLPDAWDTQAVEELRKVAPSTPIVALTGRDDDALGDRIIKAGAQDYLCKHDLTDRALRRSIRYAQQRRELELELEHRAHCDGLTGLRNRAAYDQDIYGLESTQTPFGIVLLDIDKFKLINDRLGHPTGDSVLRTTAERVSATLCATAIAYRIGGDELAVLMPGEKSLADVHAAAMALVDALCVPVIVGPHQVEVTVSGGCAHFPSEQGRLEDVVRLADTRLYAAKTTGRARLGEADSGEKVAKERKMEWDLRDAARTNAFELVFQPQTPMGQFEPRAFEALLRWNVDGAAAADPNEFVPLLERCGLIASVGETVIVESLRWLATFRQRHDSTACVAVNVSPLQVGLPGFTAVVARALADAGLSGDALCVELTEGTVLSDLPAARATMERLREMGVGIAIDDFGTGNASLSLLMELPFTQLKIDQSFVRRRDDAVVRAIVALAHSLGLVVVVVGVESAEQARWVEGLGCDAIQGFWVGMPECGESWL